MPFFQLLLTGGGFFFLGDIPHDTAGTQGASQTVAQDDTVFVHVTYFAGGAHDTPADLERLISFEDSLHFAHDRFVVVRIHILFPVPVKIRKFDPVDVGHFLIPTSQSGLHVILPEPEAGGGSCQLHIAVNGGDFFLGPLALRDVDKPDNEHVIQRHGIDDHITTRPVFAADAEFHRFDAAAGAGRFFHGRIPDGEGGSTVIFVGISQPGPVGHCRDILQGVSECLGELPVEESYAGICLRLVDGDRDGQVVEDTLQARFAGGQLLLDLFARGDVGQNTLPHNGAIRHGARRGFGFDPADLPRQQDAAFFVERKFALEGLGVLGQPDVVVLGVDAGEGIEQILPRGLALDPGQGEETPAHE